MRRRAIRRQSWWSNATFNVTGTGEARTGGNAPTFVKESRGDLILDGTNGTERVVNEWSASFDRSRVVLPACPFLELDAYTVEFWAKFNGIVEASGPVAADSKTLTQHAPIMRIVPADSPDYGSVGYSSSNYDWYLFRQKNSEKGIQMAIDGSYGASTVPHNLVVDGKWHHYALTFEPKPDSATNSYVQCFCDYEAISKRTFNRPKKRVAGHRLILGEGFNDNPNIQMEFDALRISKGVLDPSQFLGRVKSGFRLIVR